MADRNPAQHLQSADERMGPAVGLHVAGALLSSMARDVA